MDGFEFLDEELLNYFSTVYRKFNGPLSRETVSRIRLTAGVSAEDRSLIQLSQTERDRIWEKYSNSNEFVDLIAFQKMVNEIIGHIVSKGFTIPLIKKATAGWFGAESVDCIIEDFLYLGNAAVARSWTWLEKEGINGVVNITMDIECAFEGKGIDYMTIRIEDEESEKESLELQLEAAVNFIGRQTTILNYFSIKLTFYFEANKRKLKQKVLVHCVAGISRSATVVLAFLIKHENCTLQEAHDMVIDKRPIKPNKGFWQLLQKWEKNCAASK